MDPEGPVDADAPERRDPDARKDTRARRNAALELAFSVGPVLVAGVVLGWVGGSLLDRWLGTSPAFLSIGVLMGAAGAIVEVVRLARRLE